LKRLTCRIRSSASNKNKFEKTSIALALMLRKVRRTRLEARGRSKLFAPILRDAISKKSLLRIRELRVSNKL
jgi:hypothetical protein